MKNINLGLKEPEAIGETEYIDYCGQTQNISDRCLRQRNRSSYHRYVQY